MFGHDEDAQVLLRHRRHALPCTVREADPKRGTQRGQDAEELRAKNRPAPNIVQRGTGHLTKIYKRWCVANRRYAATRVPIGRLEPTTRPSSFSEYVSLRAWFTNASLPTCGSEFHSVASR